MNTPTTPPPGRAWRRICQADDCQERIPASAVRQQKYCGPPCANRDRYKKWIAVKENKEKTLARKRQQRAERKTPGLCAAPGCQAQFVPTPGVTGRKYCSLACVAAARRLQQAERNAGRRDYQREYRQTETQLKQLKREKRVVDEALKMTLMLLPAAHDSVSAVDDVIAQIQETNLGLHDLLSQYRDYSADLNALVSLRQSQVGELIAMIFTLARSQQFTLSREIGEYLNFLAGDIAAPLPLPPANREEG